MIKDYPFPIPGEDAQEHGSAYDESMETRTVYLFGQSMLLTLVANSLRQNPALRVLHAATREELEAQPAASARDVLIYDLEGAGEGAILPFLYKNPGMLLIGLDTETNRAVLIAGQEKRALTLERVKEIVETTAPPGQTDHEH